MESQLRLLMPILLVTGCWSPESTPNATTTPAETDSAMAPTSDTDPPDDSDTSQPDETDTSDDPSGPTPGDSSGGDTDGMEESGSGDDETGEPDPTTDTGADTTAPSVVSVSPEDGAHGVVDDASIVITFSEPMDRVSTQTAWQSASIGSVTMSWSDDDTVLTVVPSDPLAYATGSDPDVDALEFAFTLDAIATDKAGNALDAELSSRFFTLRRIELSVPCVDSLTGLIGTNSLNTAGVYAGDTQYDLQQKSMFTFALPELPNGAELVSASVSAYQNYVGGSPYGLLPGLGAMHLMDVEFETTFDAPETVALDDLGILSDDANIETKTLGVTEAVLDDYAADLPNTQFRIEFPVATDGDGILDRAQLDKSSLALEVIYLAE